MMKGDKTMELKLGKGLTRKDAFNKAKSKLPKGKTPSSFEYDPKTGICTIG